MLILYLHRGIFEAEKLNASPEKKSNLLVGEVKTFKQTIYGTSLIPPYVYVHNTNLLHYNPFIFNIWQVCVVCVRVLVCLISRVYTHCGPTYRHTY